MEVEPFPGPHNLAWHCTSAAGPTLPERFCQQSKAAGTAPELELGTTVLGAKGNAGRPDFSMTIVARLHSAYGSGTVDANSGGRDLLAGEGLVKARGNMPDQGTFASTIGAKFTGSWNCHGVVWQGP